MGVKVIRELARDIEIADEVDVLIIGGGPAGVSAAVAAARAGGTVFLVERHGFLGGMWTAGMVLTLAGYNSWLRPYQRCVAGIPGEWLARATALGGAEDNESWVLNSDPEVMKLVADQLLAEAGVRCLFHTWAAHPVMSGQHVRGVFVENVEGRTAILAKVTIDCTGNGDVLARAGAHWEKGRTLQPMTMPFRVGNVDLDPAVDHSAPVRIPIGPDPQLLQEPLLSAYASRRRDVTVDQEAMRQGRAWNELPAYGGPWFGGLEKDVVWVNTTRIHGDASDAAELTRAEIQGRKDTAAVVAYFRAHVAGFENARLLQTSTQIGVRETRRLIGRYMLTADDIRGRPQFADSVAVGCWPIDVHPAGEVGIHAMYVPLPYQIPFRCLVPQNVGNLLVAGRCVSVTREALGSVRVGATCSALGQAAGVAATLSAQQGIQPIDVDARLLREVLISQGAIVDPPG